MPTKLSLNGQKLIDRLSAPKPDHPDFVGGQDEVDIGQISREELTLIWQAARRVEQDNLPASRLKQIIWSQMHDTGYWPAMNDEQIMDYLAECAPLQWWIALHILVWRIDRSFPLPQEIGSKIVRLVGSHDQILTELQKKPPTELVRTIITLFCLIRHVESHFDKLELSRLCESILSHCSGNAFRRAELKLIFSLSHQDLLAQSWMVRKFDMHSDHRYHAHHEWVLREACTRVEAIHSGLQIYVPYKAFNEDEMLVISESHRFGAHCNAPWLPTILDRLITLLCHAPDKASKSLPSQTLCCKLAQNISELPTPEGISSLQNATALCVNATVKKVLVQRKQQANTELAKRPEIVLGLVANGQPDKKQQSLLARLLQASYWTGLDFSFEQWREQLALSVGAGEFSQKLIWIAQFPQVPHEEPETGNPNSPSFMFINKEGTISFINHYGALITLPENVRIRLWHPLDSSREERLSWQQQLTQVQLLQPFRQAFRELYLLESEDITPPPREENPLWHSNENWCFSEHMLSLKLLIGVAKSEAWKIDRELGLVRTFGKVTATFGVDIELHNGIDGNAESMALGFWRDIEGRLIRLPLHAVPPKLYSEACRSVDLLIAVSSFAYTGNDCYEPLTLADIGLDSRGKSSTDTKPNTPHPAIRRWRRLSYLSSLNLREMAAMRQQVLAQAFKDQIEEGLISFEGHVAKIGDYQVNLRSATVTLKGEHVSIKISKHGKNKKLAALPWLPYDEALLEKLVATLAALL